VIEVSEVLERRRRRGMILRVLLDDVAEAALVAEHEDRMGRDCVACTASSGECRRRL